MEHFRKDGRRFHMAPKGAGWVWSIHDLDGSPAATGEAPTKAIAAARIVSATLACVDWPAGSGMTRRSKSEARP